MTAAARGALLALLLVPLVQLLEELDQVPPDLAQGASFKGVKTYGDLVSAEGIALLKSYATGVGPWKGSILPREELSTPQAGIRHRLSGEVHPFLARVRAAGLHVRGVAMRSARAGLDTGLFDASRSGASRGTKRLRRTAR